MRYATFAPSNFDNEIVACSEVKAPEEVSFSEHQESESLTVTWTRPSCTETGYISHFVVVYCLEEHCEGSCTLQMTHSVS